MTSSAPTRASGLGELVDGSTRTFISPLAGVRGSIAAPVPADMTGNASSDRRPLAPPGLTGARSPPPPPLADDGSLRAKKRRDLMLDDDALKSTTWEPRAYVWWRRWIYWALCILTAGTVWIIGTWECLRKTRARFQSRPCSHADADFFIITSATDGAVDMPHVETVHQVPRELLDWSGTRARNAADAAARASASQLHARERMVVYRHTRFLFSSAVMAYRQLDPEESTLEAAVNRNDGLADAAAASRRLTLFGRNVIEVPIPPWPTLLLRECVHPFVIFQVWAVIVWMTEAYYSFSAFIFASALLTAFANFWEVRKNLLQIRALSRYTRPVTAIRGGAAVRVDSGDLVPGDLLEVETDMRLPCDAVLVRGAVTVNEAMLTGESAVVTKTPAPASLPLNDAEARHTLFGGSMVAQVRAGPGQRVLAVVVRTGFESVKGRLVLAILHPRVPAFKFMQQSLLFVAALFVLAMCGFAINAKALADDGTDVAKIIQRGCDMVTIVVPPALPLALTVGIAYALVALRRDRIVCISPQRVNLAGKVNWICFDKTGTLTEEGLAFRCVRQAQAQGAHADAGGAAFEAADAVSPDALRPLMRALLAACHSLARVKGTLAGDPLDVQTFAFSGAVLHEGGHAAVSGAEAAAPAIEIEVPLPAGSAPPSADAEDASSAPWAADIAGVERALLSCVRPFSPAGKAALADGSRLRTTTASFAPTPLAGASTPQSSSSTPASASAAASHAVPLAVLRVFDFVPALQRMGVLVRLPAAAGGSGGPVVSLVKGAPEMIASLCEPGSLPPDFDAVLRRYTAEGLRVLAAGARLMPSDAPLDAAAPAEVEALRGTAESALTFLGLVVLENGLKPQSAPAIARLQSEGALPCVMITGDNAVSAVTVARKCGIVPRGTRVFIGDLSLLPRAPDSFAVLPAGGQSPAPAASPDGSSGGSGDASPGFVASVGTSPAGSPGFGAGSGARLTWTDVDDESSHLNPVTLLPLPGCGSGSSGRSTLPYVLALTGRGFAHLQDAVRAGELEQPHLQRVVLGARVFARASPEGKAAIVEVLQGTGLYTMMVGDGANDSLALRAAHVGVSLSQAEASVSAPFSSLEPHIGCVLRVLCEGRGALATSFCLFQFMALYSTVQFANALLIVFQSSFLSNNEYLVQDLIIVFVLALTMGATPSSRTLTRKRPSANLLSLYNLLLSAGFIALTFLFQLWAFRAVQAQPWYDTPEYPAAMNKEEDTEGTNSVIPETTSVFLMAGLQYVAVAAIFSIGWPWKLSTLRNWAFSGWLLLVAVLAVWLFGGATPGVLRWIGLQALPHEWRMTLLGYSVFAFFSYWLLLGACYAARRLGALSWLQREAGVGCCRRQKSLHRRMRETWQRQMAAVMAGGRASAVDVAAAAGDRHSAVVVASPLRTAAAAATAARVSMA